LKRDLIIQPPKSLQQGKNTITRKSGRLLWQDRTKNL